MALDSEKLLDKIGWKLLRALQDDARLSFADLAKLVKLSPPAVAERVRKLEDAGIITGYRAEVNREKIGLPLTVILQISATPDKYPRILKLAQELREVLEVHHVSGDESFIMKLAVSSVQHLEEVIRKFSVYGTTSSRIVLSSPIRKTIIEWESKNIS